MKEIFPIFRDEIRTLVFSLFFEFISSSNPTFPENHLFEGKNRFFFSGKYDESSIISLKIADVVT